MSRRANIESLISILDRDMVAMSRAMLVKRFGEHAFRVARASGQIVAALPHVYVHVRRSRGVKPLIAAAAQWAENRAHLGGLAACHLHGLRTPKEFVVTIVAAPHRKLMTIPKLRVRRLRSNIPVMRQQGYRVATLPHALVQVWWDEGPEQAQSLIIDAIRQRRCTAQQLLAVMPSYPRLRNRRGLITFLTELRAGVESYLEYIADTTIFNTPDLAHLQKQVEVTAEGRRYRLDAYDPETKTAIELDGAAFHGDDAARRRDIERDGALAAIGILTLRFTYDEATQYPAQCRERIRATLAHRRIPPDRGDNVPLAERTSRLALREAH